MNWKKKKKRRKNNEKNISGASLSTPNNQKKSYGRPKSAEPGSPLLRRALSPDRLHPRSAENKTSISPLANTVVRVTPRLTKAQSTLSESLDEAAETQSRDPGDGPKCSEKKLCMDTKQVSEYTKLTHGISINIASVSLSNSCGSTQLPRIAEEKDSPTGTKSEEKEILEKNTNSFFNNPLPCSSHLSQHHERQASLDSGSKANESSFSSSRTAATTSTPAPSSATPATASFDSNLQNSSKATSIETRLKTTVSSSTPHFGNVPWRRNNEFETTTTTHQLSKLTVHEAKSSTKSKPETDPRKILKRSKPDSADVSSQPTTSVAEKTSLDDKCNKWSCRWLSIRCFHFSEKIMLFIENRWKGSSFLVLVRFIHYVNYSSSRWVELNGKVSQKSHQGLAGFCDTFRFFSQFLVSFPVDV